MGDFTCKICFDLFNKGSQAPIQLNCGHTYCRRCVIQLGQAKKTITCAHCRKNTYSHPKKLPKNTALIELLEQHNMLGEEDDTTAECESVWQGTDSFLLRNDIEEFFDQLAMIDYLASASRDARIIQEARILGRALSTVESQLMLTAKTFSRLKCRLSQLRDELDERVPQSSSQARPPNEESDDEDMPTHRQIYDDDTLARIMSTLEIESDDETGPADNFSNANADEEAAFQTNANADEEAAFQPNANANEEAQPTATEDEPINRQYSAMANPPTAAEDGRNANAHDESQPTATVDEPINRQHSAMANPPTAAEDGRNANANANDESSSPPARTEPFENGGFNSSDNFGNGGFNTVESSGGFNNAAGPDAAIPRRWGEGPTLQINDLPNAGNGWRWNHDVPNRQMGQRDVPNRQVSQDGPNRRVGQRDVPNRQVGQDVPNRQVGQRDLPNRQIGQREVPNRQREVPNRQWDDVPNRHGPNRQMGQRDVPNRRVGQRDVPNRQVGQDVPNRQVGQDVPNRQWHDVPNRQGPNRQMGQRDVPNRRVGQRDVPNRQVGQDVPNRQVGQDVPNRQWHDVPNRQGPNRQMGQPEVPNRQMGQREVPNRQWHDVPNRQWHDVPNRQWDDVPNRQWHEVPNRQWHDVPNRHGPNCQWGQPDGPNRQWGLHDGLFRPQWGQSYGPNLNNGRQAHPPLQPHRNRPTCERRHRRALPIQQLPSQPLAGNQWGNEQDGWDSDHGW